MGWRNPCSSQIADPPVNRAFRSLEEWSSTVATGDDVEAWHVFGAAGEPALDPALDSSSVIRFYKDRERVWVEFSVTAPTAAPSPLFTLPTGYRPDIAVRAVNGSGIPAGGSVAEAVDEVLAPDGTLGFAGPSPSYQQLEGALSFRAA